MSQFRKVETVMNDRILEAMIRAGVRQGDQVFQSETYGLFNVAMFERLFKSSPKEFELASSPLNQDTYDYIRSSVEINEKHVLALTPEQIVKPVYAVHTPDEPEAVFLIDGWHRIVRRFWDGEDHVNMVCAKSKRVYDLVNFYKW